MTDDKKIEEAFAKFWETETEYPGNMKAQNLESYKAGYLAAMEEIKKEMLCSGCNDIVLKDGLCDICNWVKKPNKD